MQNNNHLVSLSYNAYNVNHALSYQKFQIVNKNFFNRYILRLAILVATSPNLLNAPVDSLLGCQNIHFLPVFFFLVLSLELLIPLKFHCHTGLLCTISTWLWFPYFSVFYISSSRFSFNLLRFYFLPSCVRFYLLSIPFFVWFHFFKKCFCIFY